MALSHKKLTSWYLQLAQSQEAGLTFAQSLRTSAGPPASDLNAMADRIEAGNSVDDLMRNPPKWFPKSDRYFVSAAASTGRLPQTFQNLSERHASIGANIQKMMLGLLYPLGVLNFACLLLPINDSVSFENGFAVDWSHYLGSILPPLGFLWGGLLLIYLLVKFESPIIPTLMQWMPGLRDYYRNKIISAFAYGLGTFLNAGIPIDKSWAGAGLISGDKGLKKVASDMKTLIDQGGAPGEHLAKYVIFPDDFRALYLTGERTGQLDANLLKIGKTYQQKANHNMTMTAIIYPSLIFLVVAGFMAYHIVMLYAGYFESIMSIAE